MRACPFVDSLDRDEFIEVMFADCGLCARIIVDWQTISHINMHGQQKNHPQASRHHLYHQLVFIVAIINIAIPLLGQLHHHYY